MPGKRKDRPDPASPTYRQDLAAFRKSGQRPRGYRQEKRDGEVVLAMIEHDGNRKAVAEALGITIKALEKRLARSPKIVEQVERVREDIARKAVELAGEQAMTKAEALIRASRTARGQGEAWYQTMDKDGNIVTLKRGPTFTEGTGAMALMGKMLPGWTQEQRKTVTVELAERFIALPADRRRELIATHGARAPEIWAAELVDEEAEEALLELPAP